MGLVKYGDANEWTGTPGKESKDAIPLPASEVVASLLVPDDLTPGFPIENLVTGGPGAPNCGPTVLVMPDPLPLEHFHLVAVSGVALQLADIRPWRVVVTITAVGDAAQFELSHRSDFLQSQFFPSDLLPIDISVLPGRRLWLRHTTGVDQLASFMIEPRGECR